jgi:hypothetical protein
MRVTVSFGGLMVFQPEEGGYSISVAKAKEHTLKALVDDEDKTPDISSDATSWFLEVTGYSTTSVSTIEVGHDRTRYPDSVVGQYDLSWMINLNQIHYQDGDYPSGGFTINRGMVNPIIHLRDGVLYSRLKTEDMDRKHGSEAYNPFGLFTETVGLDLEIPEGGALVLRPESGDPYPLLKYLAGPQPTHEVQIKNTRPGHEEYRSDFQQYYGLLNQSVSAKYDFRESSSPRGRPHNPVRRPKKARAMPEMKKRRPTKQAADKVIVTCCGLECNPIYLGPITR